MKVFINGVQLTLVRATYAVNGATVLQLLGNYDEVQFVATTNVPDVQMPSKDHVLIKNYSENEGVMEQLIEQGIIHEPIGEFLIGHVTIPLCELKATIPTYNEYVETLN